MYSPLLARILTCITLLAANGVFAAGEITRSHGYTLFGELKYPANFSHFDYVNPEAPKGGDIRLMATGTFDSFNPYCLKGLSPSRAPGYYMYGFLELNEPLLVGTGSYAPSGDEPQSAYGLIAESLEYPQDRSWVIFNIRKAARFHDGSPVTADDVAYSFQLLKEHGHPEWKIRLKGVSNPEILGKHRIKFTLEGDDRRSLPLRAGEIPVMSKTFWSAPENDFSKAALTPVLNSGPYKIGDYKAGQYFELVRVDDYWGKDLPVNRGRYNFDNIRVDYYKDLTVALEAFKSGEYDIHLEYISKNWMTAYDFPALHEGKVTKAEIPHKIPQGSQAFFFNTRRPMFSDARVREAIGYLFDFEWTNKNIFSNAYSRSLTFYPNSDMASRGLPSPQELAILEPFKTQLPPALFETEFSLPVTEGNGNIRNNMRKALELFREAGWENREGKLVNSNGEQFRFEILGRQHSMVRVVQPFMENLGRAGIEVEMITVDASSYKVRLDDFDYDMVVFVLPQSSTPGHEQLSYYHSSQAEVAGSANYAGIKSPVVDSLVEQIIAAPDYQTLKYTTRALDRVLLWNHYTIPHWYIGYHRVAYWNKFGIPAVKPDYILGFRDWWIKPPAENNN